MVNTSVKKQKLKSTRKISFWLSGQEVVNMDLQIKRETGFRTKSRLLQNITSKINSPIQEPNGKYTYIPKNQVNVKRCQIYILTKRESHFKCFMRLAGANNHLLNADFLTSILFTETKFNQLNFWAQTCTKKHKKSRQYIYIFLNTKTKQKVQFCV